MEVGDGINGEDTSGKNKPKHEYLYDKPKIKRRKNYEAIRKERNYF